MKKTNSERISEMERQIKYAVKYNKRRRRTLVINETEMPNFSDDQKKAYEVLKEFLDNDYEFLFIEGFAGTGKTFLINKFVDMLSLMSGDKPDISLTAPTNKAVRVLKEIEQVTSKNIEFQTIHKLLGLKLKMDYADEDNPKYVLYQDYNKQSEYPMKDLVIIDEASMIDDELWSLIVQGKGETKTILLGDPAQIPPVGQAEAIPLTKDGRQRFNIQHITLNQIMRQAGDNTIVPFATELRNKRFDDVDRIERKNTNNVHFYSALTAEGKSMWTRLMLSDFLSVEFKENANHAKAIAWRNKSVNALNQIVRRALFGTNADNELTIGEKIIFDKPVIDMFNAVIFSTSDEATIESVVEKSMEYQVVEQTPSKHIDLDLFGGSAGNKVRAYHFTYYEAVVSYYDDGVYLTRTIDILSSKSADPFKWAVSKLISTKQYDEYEKLTRRFAQVKYNYAITAHKAQGSTYTNVYLFEDDLDMNRNAYEKNRIKYTACTRPKSQLHILTSKV